MLKLVMPFAGALVGFAIMGTGGALAFLGILRMIEHHSWGIVSLGALIGILLGAMTLMAANWMHHCMSRTYKGLVDAAVLEDEQPPLGGC